MGGGAGGGVVEFDAEFKFAKIQNSHGGVTENYAEFKFAKIQNSHFVGGAGGLGFTEFDAEFKFAKIQNSHFVGEWGVGGLVETNFQLLMSSSNLLKKKFFCEKFSKFSGKNWNGFVLEFKYRVIYYTLKFNCFFIEGN